MSLFFVGQQLTIYAGIFLAVIGVIGNGINILVFSSVRTYRTNSATFCFLIASIFNMIYILINLISRIIMSGFGIDLTAISLTFCKLRPFCLSTLCLISLSCCCLATIDQFLLTSRSVYLRSLNNIKSTYRLVSIIIIVWCLHGIPFVIYYEISSKTQICYNTNAILSVYFPTIYILTLNCWIPVIIMTIFAYLAYMNIQSTRALIEQQADRQLLRMIFILILLVIISYVQFGIYNSYLLLTANMIKDRNRLLLDNLFGSISNLVCYFYFSGTCYIFLISSSRFRRETKDMLLFCRKPNQITQS